MSHDRGNECDGEDGECDRNERETHEHAVARARVDQKRTPMENLLTRSSFWPLPGSFACGMLA